MKARDSKTNGLKPDYIAFELSFKTLTLPFGLSPAYRLKHLFSRCTSVGGSKRANINIIEKAVRARFKDLSLVELLQQMGEQQ
jgi:hypothetical protein